jgi:rubrerythrin
MGTKGTWQRPASVGEEERARRWERTFQTPRDWLCGFCGEPNTDMEARVCALCGVPRDWEPNDGKEG